MRLRAAGYAFALIPAVAGERLIEMYAARTGAAVVDEFDYDVGRFRADDPGLRRGHQRAQRAGARARRHASARRRGARLQSRRGAGALDVARAHGVAALALPWDRARESRAAYDARADRRGRAHGAAARAAAGLDAPAAGGVLARFPETINLHPAFLPLDPAADRRSRPTARTIPALRGAHALRDALRAGVPWSGATVHHVTGATDRGAVLVRAPLAVGDATTEAALRERVRPLEFADRRRQRFGAGPSNGDTIVMMDRAQQYHARGASLGRAP